jgi:hypothetical protein
MPVISDSGKKTVINCGLLPGRVGYRLHMAKSAPR